MNGHGYECKNLAQLGETYMLSDYTLAVISGTYEKNGNTVDAVHLAHLDFENTQFRVINLYAGQAAQEGGYYPNTVSINGRTVIWTTCTPSADEASRFNYLRLYLNNGSMEEMPVIGESAVYRLTSGDTVNRIVPVTRQLIELSQWEYGREYLVPTIYITHGNNAKIEPITGEILSVSDYPEAPDAESKAALNAAMQTAGLLDSRGDFSLLSAKEYSGRLYACITYTRNNQTVYELVISDLTIEGEIIVLGVCEFAPPTERGYQMFSTAIENDIICWTLLNETRLDGYESVLMDFNAFQFCWENGDTKDDLIVDRFFIYVNKHVPLPITCIPIVNGNPVDALSSGITRVSFQKVN